MYVTVVTTVKVLSLNTLVMAFS